MTEHLTTENEKPPVASATPPSREGPRPGSRAPGPDLRRRVRKRRRRKRGLRGRPLLATCLLAALLLVVLFGVTAVRGYLHVRAEVTTARDALTRAEARVPTLLEPSASDTAVRADLETARKSLHRAKVEISTSPGLRLLAALPVVGPSVRSAEDLVVVVEAVSGAGRDALDALGGVRSATGGRFVSVSGGTISVGNLAPALPGLRRAEARLRGARAAATALDTDPSGPVREYAARAVEVYERAADTVTKAAAGLALAPAALGADGPRRYLLALRNNAELRADGGMALSIGEVAVEGGRVTLARVQSVGDADLEADADLQVPNWYRYTWGPYGGLRLYQSVDYTAHFPTAAAVMAGLYRTKYGVEVDGVIAVDPVGLAGLLGVLGALDVDGVRLDAATAAPYLLNGQYALTRQRRVNRREVLEDTAAAVFSRLAAGGWDERALGAALANGSAEGHVQLWMRRAGEQRDVTALGVSGAFAPSGGDFLRVAVQNQAGNKLDYFMERTVKHAVRLRTDGSAELETTLTVRNAVPLDQPPYVLGGPDLGVGLARGEYQGFLGVFGPEKARLVRWDAGGGVLQIGEEAGYPTFRTLVRIPAGETKTVRFTSRIARFPTDWRSGHLHLVFQPQALVRPDHVEVSVTAPPGWTVGGHRAWTQRVEVARTVHLDVPTARRKG